MKHLAIAAALIISLSLVPSISLARDHGYRYKLNPNTPGTTVLVPKKWKQRFNVVENRWEYAPKDARLVYDTSLQEWRYIPGIIPR